MKKVLRNKKIRMTQTSLLVIMLLAIILVASISSPNFLTWRNVKNILNQNAVIGILTIGMAIVMIAGGIDLGVGHLVSFTACFMALLLRNGVPEPAAVIASLAVSTACGFLTGMIIANTTAQPFIITLGMMNVYKAAALITANGSDMPIGTAFQFLGKTYLATILLPVWIFLALFLLLGFVLRRTGFGRIVYTVGSNEEAAFISGINIKRRKVLLYTLNGLIVGFSALVLLSRLGSATPTMGDGYEMNAISACAIGGITLTGGVGSASGAFLGVLFLGIVRNSLNLMGVPTFYQYLVNGAIIIVAVIFSNYSANKKS